MNKCEYCFQWHAREASCPDNRRDKMHATASLEPTLYYREPSYGERLREGSVFLHYGEETVRLQHNCIKGSGEYQ